MYSVSNKYKVAIKKDIVQTRLKVYINDIEYGEEKILAGSFKITNQCTETSDVKLGAVYAGELSATFMNVPISRANWKGKVIKPIFSVLVDEDEWEDVPLGFFTVTEATHSKTGVTVKAYDDMRLFDKSMSLAQGSGKLYDYLINACSACHVTMAQTETQLNAFPNGTLTFSIFAESDISTWRDLLSWIAQTYGGFATINREGKLEIRTYGSTAVDSLSPSNRHDGGTFSDYVTKYTGISYLDIASKQTRYTGATIDDGSTMTLGGNPFLQNRQQATLAVANLLTAISAIQYTPFKISTVSNPAYDLADIIEFTAGIAGTASTCCLMNYVFTFRKSFTMQGYGADPEKASAKSKVDKNLAGLLAEVSATEMSFYEYRNQKAIAIRNEFLKQVLKVKMISKTNTRAQIHININLETEKITGADFTNLVAEYMINGDVEPLKPKETYVDGFHVLHLMYILPMIANITVFFVLRLQANDGNIDIDRQGVWFYASGLGLVGDGTWDGTFDFEEEEILYTIVESTFKADQESMIISVITPITITASDTQAELTFTETTFDDSVTEGIYFGGYLSNLTWSEAYEMTWATAYQDYLWGE